MRQLGRAGHDRPRLRHRRRPGGRRRPPPPATTSSRRRRSTTANTFTITRWRPRASSPAAAPPPTTAAARPARPGSHSHTIRSDREAGREARLVVLTHLPSEWTNVQMGAGRLQEAGAAPPMTQGWDPACASATSMASRSSRYGRDGRAAHRPGRDDHAARSGQRHDDHNKAREQARSPCARARRGGTVADLRPAHPGNVVPAIRARSGLTDRRSAAPAGRSRAAASPTRWPSASARSTIPATASASATRASAPRDGHHHGGAVHLRARLARAPSRGPATAADRVSATVASTSTTTARSTTSRSATSARARLDLHRRRHRRHEPRRLQARRDARALDDREGQPLRPAVHDASLSRACRAPRA